MVKDGHNPDEKQRSGAGDSACNGKAKQKFE